MILRLSICFASLFTNRPMYFFHPMPIPIGHSQKHRTVNFHFVAYIHEVFQRMSSNIPIVHKLLYASYIPSAHRLFVNQTYGLVHRQTNGKNRKFVWIGKNIFDLRWNGRIVLFVARINFRYANLSSPILPLLIKTQKINSFRNAFFTNFTAIFLNV